MNVIDTDTMTPPPEMKAKALELLDELQNLTVLETLNTLTTSMFMVLFSCCTNYSDVERFRNAFCTSLELSWKKTQATREALDAEA